MKQQETEPTLEELASLVEVSPEELAFALDAIQSPVSLYEPVYSEGGDTLYIMDQISDKKNRENTWVEHLSLETPCNAFQSGKTGSLNYAILRVKPRWK